MKKLLALAVASALLLCGCTGQQSSSQESGSGSGSSTSVSASSDEKQPSGSSSKSEDIQITLILKDSNGGILADEDVVIYTGEHTITGKTDSDGKAKLTLPPTDEGYELDLPSFDSSLRYETPGAGLFGMYFSAENASVAGEIEYIVRVYPMIEQTLSENCIVLTLCNSGGKPLQGLHIFYSTEMAGTESITPTTPVLGLGLEASLGMTDENGRIILHNPEKTGEYRFYYTHPEDGFQRKVYAAVTLDQLEGVQEFSFNAPEYPVE